MVKLEVSRAQQEPALDSHVVVPAAIPRRGHMTHIDWISVRQSAIPPWLLAIRSLHASL